MGRIYQPTGRAGRPGSSTRNDEPPPSRPSTQARPPWSSANRATSASPIPDPGACSDGVGPRSKAPKMEPRSPRGYRGPRRRPGAARRVVGGGDADPDPRGDGCVPRRVHEEVLHDPLDLRRVDLRGDTLRLDADLAAGQDLGLIDHAADERAHVGGRALWARGGRGRAGRGRAGRSRSARACGHSSRSGG